MSFAIERGETVAILGQNGSGKSTLVRLLSTLLLPDGGSAEIFGHDVVRDARPVRRLVNRVSVEASFFKKMSADREPELRGAVLRDVDGQTRDRIPEILGRVGFPEDRRDESMENLSRGMQQKVALARALLTSPVVLLLDEPTTGLDPRSKLEVQEFIREIRDEPRLDDPALHPRPRRGGDACRRVGILDRGRLLVLEPADELKRGSRRHARGGVLRRDRPRVRGGREDEDDDREVIA